MLALIVAGLIFGCGATKEIQQEVRLVWPEPPDTARIAYVRTYRGEDDFSTGLGGFVNILDSLI